MIGQNIKEMIEDYGNHEFVFMSSKDCDLTNRYETHCYFQNGNFDFNSDFINSDSVILSNPDVASSSTNNADSL